MTTASLPDSLAALANTAEPLESVALRLPTPALKELDDLASTLNASRAAVARRVVALGLLQLREQLAAAGVSGPDLRSPRRGTRNDYAKGARS